MILFIAFDLAEAEDEIIEITSTAGFISVLNRIIGNTEDRHANNFSHETVSSWLFSYDHLPTDKLHILSLLLNYAMCLYHISGHKQLVDVRHKYNHFKFNYYRFFYYIFCLVLVVQREISRFVGGLRNS